MPLCVFFDKNRHELTYRGNPGLVVPEDCIFFGNVCFTPEAVAYLGRQLGIPTTFGFAPDEMGCVLLERELEQARADGVIDTSQINPPSRYRETWKVGVDKKGTGHLYFDAPTKLEALRAAVARVRELRAEAERVKLPSTFDLNVHECAGELQLRGWRFTHTFRPAWTRDTPERGTGVPMLDNETILGFHRRVLREARKLDGDADAHTEADS